MNSRQQGFTIVEVVISMVLMAIILTTLGGLIYTSARTALIVNEETTRRAASMALVNRYVAMPFDSLPEELTPDVDTIGTPNNLYELRVEREDSTGYAVLNITATALQRMQLADTIRLIRNEPAAAGPGTNPLCMSC